MSRGGQPPLWQSVKIDKRMALGLKAVVLLYAMVAPFAWRDVAIDLTPVYAVGFVLGTLALSVDVTLGALFLMAVAITMVTIGRQTAAVRAAAAAVPLDSYPAYEKPHPSPPAPVRERFVPSPARPRSPVREHFVSAPAPPPPSAPAPAPTPSEETSDGEYAPEATEGPSFLLRPDGDFVTEAALEAAQTNRVGPDDVYSPLGAESYSIQGRARAVPVVPMVW